jgi:hypothetical protein
LTTPRGTSKSFLQEKRFEHKGYGVNPDLVLTWATATLPVKRRCPIM